MRYWLLKSERDCYSIDDLKHDGKTFWDGVRNYQARNMLRDDMKPGDLCIFYHSSDKPAHAAGVCEVAKEGYPDATQFDAEADHYDSDSDPENPRWFGVDVKFVQKFTRPVAITQLRANKELSNMVMLAPGSRLSVTPLTKQEFEEVVSMGTAT
jgi:predicted RNA-binding protein with PUA-like domain